MYLIVKKKNIHHNILEDETLILYNIHESPSNYIIECNDDNHVNEFINRFKIKNFKIINSEFGALTSKKYKEKTIIEIKKCTIGTGSPVFIAGPCSMEDETLILYNIHESPSNYIIECNDDNHVNEFINRFKIKNFKIINSEFGALTSKKYKEKTIIEIKKCTIGTGSPVFIAGPCSI